MIKFFIWVSAISCASMLFAAESSKLSYAVLPLKNATGVTDGEADVLSDRLRNELFKTDKVDVLEREQMQSLLKEQGFQKSGACTDEGCMVELGKMLGVNRLATGSIGKLGSMYMINLRSIDVQSAKITKVVSEDVKGGIEDVVRILPYIALQLVCAEAGSCVSAPEKPSTAEAPPAEDKSESEDQKSEPVRGGKIYLERWEMQKDKVKFQLDEDDVDEINSDLLESLGSVFKVPVYLCPQDKIVAAAGNDAVVIRVTLNSYSTKPAIWSQFQGTGTVSLTFYNGPTAENPAYAAQITAIGERQWGDTKPFINMFEAIGEQIESGLRKANYIKQLNASLK